MNTNAIGLMLIDAPASILNNHGMDAGELTDNCVIVKTIKRGNKQYPYMSPQALRYIWRNTLSEKFDWKLSPIERDKKTAFTAVNPFEYPDDDVFGYMRAQGKKEGGTVTRMSPLKCTPLISVTEQKPTNDYGVMARHEGNPVPYEYQFYSTIMKGAFSLDLDSVGVYYYKDKTGYKNLSDKSLKKADDYNCKIDEEEKACMMPIEERAKRAKETIAVLPYIYGGAKQTTHLTDLTPKFILLCLFEGGNHIFMNVIKEVNREMILSLEALEEVMTEYKECIKTNIYIGKRKGFLDEMDEQLMTFAKDHTNVTYGSMNDTIQQFTTKIENYYLG